MWWAVHRLCDAAGREEAMHDRYLNVDDPRDPPAPAPDAHAAAGAPDDQFPIPSPIGKEQGTGATEPAPAPESEADRCVRVMREVLLSPPGPHDLVAGVADVERRLREGPR
jgi:hypothetical protein